MTIITVPAEFEQVFDDCFLFYKENWSIFILVYIEKFITQFKINQQRKMIGHHTRFQEKDTYFPLWQSPAVNKKLPFFNACTLITSEIMHRGDVQCNTGE